MMTLLDAGMVVVIVMPGMIVKPVVGEMVNALVLKAENVF